MEIVIASAGLPSGPDTLKHYSLGGSETAAINMAKELRLKGHLVTIFTNLPPIGREDHVQSGHVDDIGLRWVSLEHFQNFIMTTPVDLLVVSRIPNLLMCQHRARKAVLWMHDLATYRQFQQNLMSIAFNIDEIWCVSEYHRQQIHKVTGYPLNYIKATRNGITKFDMKQSIRNPKQLLYAARPERGLINLVRPGGIMDLLPEYNLVVTMYDNFPESMRGYYQQLFAWCDERPNVKLIPPSTQKELRELMAQSAAYVYPTQFEEVSCIIARECIEQRLPMITTSVGALPETLGDCGVFYYGEPPVDDDDGRFVSGFASFVRGFLTAPGRVSEIERAMKKRDDLYWDKVADQWLSWTGVSYENLLSRALSLYQDSDVIPAKVLIENAYGEVTDDDKSVIARLYRDIVKYYPYLFGRETIKDYYERYYVAEEHKGARTHPHSKANPRHQAIRDQISPLPSGSWVLDYGCAEGVNILDLAEEFPDKTFVGIDFVESNIAHAQKYRDERGLKNVILLTGSTDDWPTQADVPFDAVIFTEIMEHVEKPWALSDFLEGKAKQGARMILTVPSGPWEWGGLISNKDSWKWRAHIWHIDKWMLRTMFAEKKNCSMVMLTSGKDHNENLLGHLVYSYDADQIPAIEIDPLEKAGNATTRQRVGAAIIAMNSEDSIMKMLNSIAPIVDQIKVALGPTTDNTLNLIKSFASSHPWIYIDVVDVPKIEVNKFGFDDARNASIEGIETDWVLWIDTDEYMSNAIGMKKFLRNNAFDSYAIHQHHFMCDPRGTPAQLDKPARLFRNNGKFRFYGKVHEHAELGFNGGPGFCFVLPDVDIGHTGYVNENARRSRFGRNFPLLEWDQKVNPERKLGKYLWLRDIIHRMRYMVEQGHANEARRLAREAVSFYKNNAEAIIGVGAGGANSVQYYSEAVSFLGQGIEIGIQANIGGEAFAVSGVFTDEQEATEALRKTIADEMTRRRSGYWQ